MNTITTALKAFLASLLAVLAVPAAKPAANVVGASYVSYATQAQVQPKQAQPEAASPLNEPTKVIVPDEAYIPPYVPPVVERCCHECKCDVCTCKYAGQCVLLKAGKHIVWIHDPKTKAWRGYASPDCKDVRDLPKAKPAATGKPTCNGTSCNKGWW